MGLFSDCLHHCGHRCSWKLGSGDWLYPLRSSSSSSDGNPLNEFLTFSSFLHCIKPYCRHLLWKHNQGWICHLSWNTAPSNQAWVLPPKSCLSNLSLHVPLYPNNVGRYNSGNALCLCYDSAPARHAMPSHGSP